MSYISNDGIEYESYEAYCNSDDLDLDIVGVMLATGRRTPQNEYEKELLAEIEQMKKEGKGIEFPFN
ncbi:MAG: hypothetical protein Q4A18_01240 [Rikenellaceae bacterium]|nr:hypothetical protein [Rikenellaceae bacterium]